ncbi:proteasome subunit alpha type-5-B-like isoform X1 [Musa acuminata AAA Group]|uniref:proteasome subunit alpha type-5-B-like isoform X1 n=1 Tax=Musa acuminata AAA Group TaxID=214697 RepID=UPI0031E1A2FC
MRHQDISLIHLAHFWQCNAKVIGSGSEGADSCLQEQYNKDLTLQLAETTALSILKQVMEEKVTPNNVDVVKVAPFYIILLPRWKLSSIGSDT